ncbi:amidohydrolase family protein [Gracilibacillus timonensis]|uniref:amidohydrolase family protein n=1 Tax=Gracilibacillus timonensis TaxID=1816696 RepID=UPI0008251020|nr:amidohydrolase [Gracilibacillus timonensis]
MLLIKGDIITMNETGDILPQGAMVINDDKIEAIGEEVTLKKQYPQAEIVDCSSMMIMPGFVNPHYHGALVVNRGVGSDTGVPPLYSRNVPQGVLLTEEECDLFNIFGYVEALRAGNTCIASNYIQSMKSITAMKDLGLRAVISERIHNIDFFRVPEGIYALDAKAQEETLAKNIEIIDKWHNQANGRITCHFGPHAPDTCTTNFLAEITSLAKRYDVGITTHLAQSKMEVAEIQRRDGVTPVQLYHDLGILGSGTVAAHCIHVTEEDQALLAQTNTSVAHVPEGNLKKGDIAPIAALEEKGVNVAICTDSMSGSMFESMRFGLAVHRLSSGNRTEPNPRHILEMATQKGAKALGMDHEIGSLEVGKKADFIAIHKNKFHIAPIVSRYGTLVHSVQASDVAHVWIDGEWCVKDSHVAGIDEGQLSKEVQQISDRCWSRYQ